MSFPKDFFWGASTSSAQVEGGYKEGGRGLSVWDVKELNPGTASFHHATGFYYNYKEDIAMMAEMGFTMFRFSISWSRILPDGEGEVSQAGIQFYKDVIAECKKHGIEPLVTIFHFDLPLKLQEKYGGWNRDMMDAYVEYCRVLFSHFKDDIKYWLTYNEQNMVIFYGAVDMAGSKINDLNEMYNEAHIQTLAQAKAIHLCHEMCPDAKIGPAPNLTTSYPNSSHPEDYIAAQNYDDLRNNFYLDPLILGTYPKSIDRYFELNDIKIDIQDDDMEIMGTCKPDFIGFNCYANDTVEKLDYYELDLSNLLGGDNREMSYLMKLMEKPGIGVAVNNEHFPKAKTDGHSFDPYAIRVTGRRLTERYHLPLIVTENGYGRPDTLEADGSIHDDYRIEHLRDTIEQMKIGIDEGANIIGYCPWSAVDLVSTREGVTKRYGFIYVDRDEDDEIAKNQEMKRYRKDSFYWYKKVIASNGKELD